MESDGAYEAWDCQKRLMPYEAYVFECQVRGTPPKAVQSRDDYDWGLHVERISRENDFEKDQELRRLAEECWQISSAGWVPSDTEMMDMYERFRD